jgi:hypothetical protein
MPRTDRASRGVRTQKDASCCYAKSDKYWTLDPQGVAWKSFRTLDSIPVFGADTRSETRVKSASP